MNSWVHKKGHQSKKCRMKAQERFAKKFPYRFSWLTEPGPEPPQTSEVMTVNNTPRELLPLQRGLVPTRSIPDKGLQFPGYPSLLCSSPPQPRLLPQRNLWEIKLLTQRFPKQGTRLQPLLCTNVDHLQSGLVSGVSRGHS
ncbi:uncharacterized protein C3orf22 homolog [Trichechus manatus latirostris]|uniref:Uncharacterized protein C3orf22 homolog n=1 Tax=Trichechus manatus latirostris TaxID=127582 RepID=A0A2Y9D6M0_TRIMA|nr:uncharacterized protein C3orf22 homolog [Trichechus manatus latirostris]